MIKLMTFVMCAVMVVGYSPNPAPVVTPEQAEFNFDPNDYPYDIMLARRLPVGDVYKGTLSVVELDGDDITLSADGLTFSGPVIIADANDPIGVALQYNYPYQYQATSAGLHDVVVTVTDSEGLADNRIMLFYDYINRPPVITGCR